MSYRRRRVPLACTLCRKRKRRCDAQRPSCSTCRELDAQCVYDELSLETISTHSDSDSQESLRRIEALLQANSQQMATMLENLQRSHPPQQDISSMSYATLPVSQTSPFSPGSFSNTDSARPQRNPVYQFTAQQVDAPIPPLMIPDKHSTSSNHLLSNLAIKEMVGYYPSDYFFRLESKNDLPLEGSADLWTQIDASIDLSQETTDLLVSSFFDNVHCYHPLLNKNEFLVDYAQTSKDGYPSGSDTTLCLVIFALGSAADIFDPSSYTHFPGLDYLRKALPEMLMASMWSFRRDPKIVQALIFAAVYFAYLARPLHSWRFVNIAATLTHFLLPRLEDRKIDWSSREKIVRIYWSCFMIECDRLAELEVPQSGLQKHSDIMPLPSFGEGMDDSETTWYLAEISIRRLLNRVHNSIYPRIQDLNNDDLELFSPEQSSKLYTICRELQRQLDTWQASIPEPFRFDLSGVRPPHHDREHVLGIRFLATSHIIYRPFVLHTVAFYKRQLDLQEDTMNLMPEGILEKCQICIESCRAYLYNSTQMLKKPSPYIWTFSIS